MNTVRVLVTFENEETIVLDVSQAAWDLLIRACANEMKIKEVIQV